MMYDIYMIVGEEFKKVKKDGEVIGYQFGLRMPYYSSVVLSLVGETQLVVDGKVVPEELMTVTLRGKTYPKLKLEDEPFEKWEFGEIGIVTVNQPDGLPSGEHTLDVRQHLKISFIDGGLYGHDVKKLFIH